MISDMKRLGFCSFLLVLLSALTSARAEVGFQARVDRTEAAYEDEIQLTLEVNVDDPAIKTTPLPPPEMIAFRIGGSGSSVERAGERIVRKYTYVLRPARSGELTIPAFQVEFVGSVTTDTLRSEPIVIQVAQPKPVKKPSGSTGMLYGGIAVGVAILAALGYALRRKQKNVEPDAPDWRIQAQAEFEGIVKLADREDFAPFSAEASKFVIRLLENEHEAKLSGYTFADVLRWMEERAVDSELRAAVRDLFAYCEEVKFGTGKPDVTKGRAAAATAQKIVELLTKTGRTT